MKRIEIILKGIRPMLQNKMSPEDLENLRDKTRKKPSTAQKPSPHDEAEQKIYTVDGKPVVPSENLMSCLIAAGIFIRLDGKRQLTTSKGTILPGLLVIETPVLWLRKPEDGKKPSQWGIAEWRYEIRQGRNPNGVGGAVAICRPRFDAWAISLIVQVDEEAMPLDTYRKLFDHAGLRVGLCDFRPACKGTFGQFRVDLWKVLSDETTAVAAG